MKYTGKSLRTTLAARTKKSAVPVLLLPSRTGVLDFANCCTKSTNANIRLKALGLLGKVTEIGLFTEKIEIKKEELTDSELDMRIKEKLNRFMGVVDVQDVLINEP